MAFKQRDDGGLRELALFAGAGGGILGGILLGWRTVCAVEINAYCAQVLMQRQNDGCLPPFPIWDDVRTFDGRPWRGLVDVISGGFPCQDISAAGKGAGIDGERSGLWSEYARIVGEARPRYVFVENSPMLTSRGIGRVLGDLAALGFDARWGVLGGCCVGAHHRRERLWIVANSKQIRQPWIVDHVGPCSLGETADFPHEKRPTSPVSIKGGSSAQWWASQPLASEPWMGRLADGVANRMERLQASGNGQIPSVAQLAWETLKP